MPKRRCRSAGICQSEQTGRFHVWETAEVPDDVERDVKPARIISRKSYATYDEVVRAFRGQRTKSKGKV